MAFCQGLCNRISQPPLQLRGVGIYSHGCKQGCLQPPRPGGVAGANVPDSAIMWQGRWYSSTMVVMYTRAGPPGGWNEEYEPVVFGEVAVLTARDCRARLEGRSSSPRAWIGMGLA